MQRTAALTSIVAALTALACGASARAAVGDAGADRAAYHGPHHIGVSARKTPAPQPETWAMMGAGLTLFGALARRRMVKK